MERLSEYGATRMNFDAIRKHLRRYGTLAGITRIPVVGYSMGECLELVKVIGEEKGIAFVIDDKNRFAYENLIRWMHADAEMKAIDPSSGKIISGDLRKGIYLAGGTGTGKSIAMEIMEEYAKLIDPRVVFSGETESKRIYFEPVRADEIVANYVRNIEIDSFANRHFLCVQDLGSEPVEALAMGNRMNVMQRLLEIRGDRDDQMTLITSNFRLEDKEIYSRYGERVASRLHKLCNYLEMRGADRRRR